MFFKWVFSFHLLWWHILGVAGMCSKTTVAPLDRIKILLQAHSNHYKHLGVFSGLRHIVRKESLWALYKGNSAQMVRIFPYAATQFTAFEFYKRVSFLLFVSDFLIDFANIFYGKPFLFSSSCFFFICNYISTWEPWFPQINT